jgi:hypothetical protein
MSNYVFLIDQNKTPLNPVHPSTDRGDVIYRPLRPILGFCTGDIVRADVPLVNVYPYLPELNNLGRWGERA